MKALLFDGTLHLADVPLPRREGEALIRTRMAGICATDLEIAHGYKGYHGVLGHEFVGEVVESPDPHWVGRRVCGEINVSCGSCDWCARDMPTHCRRRTVLGIIGRAGALAEYLTLPPRNLHAVPDTIADEEAVFVEPLAAAFEILEQVKPAAGDRIAVLGDGKLGLLCAQVLRTVSASVTVVGRHPRKLALAADLGLHTGDASEPAAEDLDLVVEATGSAGGLASAIAMTRPRGTVVLKSTTADAIAVDMSAAVVKELSIVGSRCGPFARAIDALRHGEVRVEPLIEARFPLDRAEDAFECAGTPGTLKVLVGIHPH